VCAERATVSMMEIESSLSLAPDLPPRVRRATVAATSKIRIVRFLHASGIIVIPTIGSITAIALFPDGVNGWHLVAAAVLYLLTILGITVGFHRLLSHRSFQAGPITSAVFIVLGSMAAQGPPLYWACNHRRHHQFTERAGDPHSPHVHGAKPLRGWRGFLHAHFGWSFTAEMTSSAVYGKDLLRCRWLAQINRLYYLWLALGLVIPTVLGAIVEGSVHGAMMGFLWGGCVRLALSYHGINGINSVTHSWGSRPFATHEQSRNNLWMALPTLGEGWHNNHHAYPGSAIFGFTWWQVDFGAWAIVALERCGLAWGVCRPQFLPQSGPSICGQNAAAPLRNVRTIASRSLQRQQHAHAFLAILVPLAGTVAAIYVALCVEPVAPLVLLTALIMYVLVGLGTAIGTHRHFTHGAFRAPDAVRVALMILGSMAGQGPVVFWVALHRMHHELADRDGDPHSPNLHGTSFLQRIRGIWHAWYGWTIKHEVPNANFYARDLLRDRLMMRVSNAYFIWVALGFVVPAAVCGAVLHSWLGALEGALWGGAVRMFAGHNAIYVITCVVHVFGSRDFECRDQSRNNGWFAIYTLGESWHNNHHAFPRAASLRMKWWQIDISGAVIKGLETLGWISQTWAPPPEEIASRRIAPSGSSGKSNQEHGLK
jgi:stearoyl-CoA desaturase (delta-9 desaturase)